MRKYKSKALVKSGRALQNYWANIRRNKALGVTHSPDNSVADLHNPAQLTAATSCAAEVLPAGEQFAVPLTVDATVERPDAVPSQPPAQTEATVEEPQPQPRLRRRRRRATPAPPAQTEAAVDEPQPQPRLRRRRASPAPSAHKHDRSLRAVAAGDKKRLAQLVRAHPALYNQHYVLHGGYAQTRYAWFDISRKMQRPESECISMWKRLKESYRAALIRRKRTLDRGLKAKPSQFENYMSFMKPFIYIWKKVAAADETGSEDDAAPSAPECPREHAVLGPAVQRQPCYPRNTLVELFRNLGETVKAFPKDIRSRVKSEVLKVVSDARDLVLSNNSVEQLYILEDVKEETMDVQ